VPETLGAGHCLIKIGADMKEDELYELDSLVNIILNSDTSDIGAIGFELIHPQPNLPGLPHGCGVAPGWFSTNSSIMANRLFNAENVPEDEYSKYFAAIDEFFNIEVESSDNIILRRKLVHDYLKKKKDEEYNMHILGRVGQIVFFLQRERRGLFG